MKKINVLINEQHTLLEEQKALINQAFPKATNSHNFIKIPASGWDLQEQKEVIETLLGQTAVFISPVPYVMAKLSFWQGCGSIGDLQEVRLSLKGQGTEVFLFHNDKREKKELPNGKVIAVISSTGWELVGL